MSYIELKWQNNDGAISIFSDNINSIIEIDEQNKQLKNVKQFFREILFNYHYNNWDKEIKLLENEDVAISEVKPIINDLIDTCNKELEG
ncbi:MAG: hypothetical protein GY756_25505 [bacterium]|nr:hypothetical protein [bacterium]